MDMLKFVDYSITFCFDALTKRESYRLTHFFTYKNSPVLLRKEYEGLKSYQEALEKHKKIAEERLWIM